MRRVPTYAGRPAGHKGQGHGPLRSACAAGRVGYPSPGSGHAAGGRGKARHAGHGREEVRHAGGALLPRGARSWRTGAALSCESRRLGYPGAARSAGDLGGGVSGRGLSRRAPPPMLGRDRREGGGRGGGRGGATS